MPADNLSDLTDDDGHELWTAHHVGDYLARLGRPISNPHVWISRAELRHVELREIQPGYPVRLYRRDDVERAAGGYWSQPPRSGPHRTDDDLVDRARELGLSTASTIAAVAEQLRIGRARARRIRDRLDTHQPDNGKGLQR